MRWLALITSISIAGVAAWYSIAGLMAIFAGATIAIAIMGGVLEVGKLVTAAWLHANWKAAPWLMKSYLTVAVLVLMVITSLGIFGFLSKAHLEHTISTGGINDLQITNLERQIQNEERTISDSTVVIAQLDRTVATLLEYDRVRGPDGAVATRKAQSDERDAMNAAIKAGTVSMKVTIAGKTIKVAVTADASVVTAATPPVTTPVSGASGLSSTVVAVVAVVAAALM